MRRKIDFISMDAGGGHKAAATALSEVIRLQKRPWDVRVLSIQDLLDPIDVIRKLTGIQFQELYNLMLRRSWTLGTAQLIPLMHLLIRLFHHEQERILERRWKQDAPDMVVSLIPHYNTALKAAFDPTGPRAALDDTLADLTA